MKIRLLHIVITFIFCAKTVVQAQHYGHFAVWTRYQYNTNLSKQWESQSILHWRRQCDMHIRQLNVAQPLMVAAQELLLYRTPQYPNTTFYVAQITFNRTRPLLGKESDFGLPMNQEFRLATGVEFTQRTSPTLSIRERVLQELRWQKSNDYSPVGRIRSRVTAFYNKQSTTTFTGFSEIVVHDPPQLFETKAFRFHQLWLGASAIVKASPHLNVEIGYTHLINRRSTVIEFDDVDILNLHFIWRY